MSSLILLAVLVILVFRRCLRLIHRKRERYQREPLRVATRRQVPRVPRRRAGPTRARAPRPTPISRRAGTLSTEPASGGGSSVARAQSGLGVGAGAWPALGGGPIVVRVSRLRVAAPLLVQAREADPAREIGPWAGRPERRVEPAGLPARKDDAGLRPFAFLRPLPAGVIAALRILRRRRRRVLSEPRRTIFIRPSR